MRKAHSAFRGSGLHFLVDAGHPQLLAYERCDERDRFLLLLNNDEAACSVIVQNGGLWQDAGSEADIKADEETIQVVLPGFGYAILHAYADNVTGAIRLSAHSALAQARCSSL
ncbi:Cyclomaltodextrinase [compost metagenome]